MLQSTFPHDAFKAWQVAIRPGDWVIREGGEAKSVTGPVLTRPLPVVDSQPIEIGEDGSLSIRDSRFPSGSWFMAWAAVFVPNHEELERTLIVPGREVEPAVRMLVSQKCVTPLGMCDFQTTWEDWERHVAARPESAEISSEAEKVPFRSEFSTKS